MEHNESAKRISSAITFEGKLSCQNEIGDEHPGAPSVFVFNAFTEGFVAEGKGFNPTKQQAQLARDLENLPQFICRPGDIVLVSRKPSVEFLSGIKHAGFALPEFVELERALTRSSADDKNVTRSVCDLSVRRLGSLRPWAWGPDSFELLKPLFAKVTEEKRGENQRFNERLAQLYSKAWSAAFLRRILPNSEKKQSVPTPTAATHSLCTQDDVGVAVNSLDQALAAIVDIRARGHHKIIVKEALGVAGSNALRLFEPQLLKSQRTWMANAFEKRQTLVIEPWLERESDFSIQLEMATQGLKLCGFTGLINDAHGRFQGNWAESHHRTQIPSRIAALFREPADFSGLLLNFYENVFQLLEAELLRAEFVGPIGIDAFVYRDAVGAMRVKPIVEINPRYTMGRVTVELMKHARPGTCGVFRLLRADNANDFSALAARLRERFPIILDGEPVPKIRSGAVCLNDASTAKMCLAIFQVGDNLEELLKRER